MSSKKAAVEVEWDEVLTAPGYTPVVEPPKPTVRINFTADEIRRRLERRLRRAQPAGRPSRKAAER